MGPGTKRTQLSTFLCNNARVLPWMLEFWKVPGDASGRDDQTSLVNRMQKDVGQESSTVVCRLRKHTWILNTPGRIW